MKALVLIVGLPILFAVSALAQSLDDLNLQIHGFATQGFLVSDKNNYLGMNTSSGSPAWTEAALNVNDQVFEKLRVGIQFHYTRLGSFGGDTLNVDWALGDYKVSRWIGVRAGKVKIRWGLFNDTQDYDPGYMWALLPESVYGVDSRETNLSQLGVEFYGRIPISKSIGTLDYSAYWGDYFYASDDGYAANFVAQGISFQQMPGGKTPGFDLRWNSPIDGLKLGGSLMAYDASGSLANASGTYNQPLAYWPTGYAEYEHKRIFLSGQYVRLVQYQIVTLQGQSPVTTLSDNHEWFVMGGYRVQDKLQAGAYYTRYTVPHADSTNPSNYYRDWTISSRYDISSNFYAKLEGHFIDGNGVGLSTKQP